MPGMIRFHNLRLDLRVYFIGGVFVYRRVKCGNIWELAPATRMQILWVVTSE